MSASLLGTVGLTTASAAEPAGPVGTLHLTWSAPEVSKQVFSATLTCSPNASSEPYHDADWACADIAAAGGDFRALPGRPGMDCSSYRGWKIRTTATGTWNGRKVNYDVLHANACEFKKATDQVFVW
ncbi:MAG TPA: SSI family serine proteinase inhibitor [Solirubrobacter sp.]|nr:SSI family serine proteinase inhibitor [Solirubrobacter sp.]